MTYEALFGTTDLNTFELGIPDPTSGDGILRSKEQCREWADKLNCEYIEAQDTELFIDVDTDQAFDIFLNQIKFLKRHFYPFHWRVTPSKQGLPHRHVTVTLSKPLPLMTRIALQACLGSDLTREMISIKRAIEGEDNVVIFFEKKV